jgi:EAL domain-containing protein (putative c-di-GMP-specific phosphodiesterase class I)
MRATARRGVSERVVQAPALLAAATLLLPPLAAGSGWVCWYAGRPAWQVGLAAIVVPNVVFLVVLASAAVDFRSHGQPAAAPLIRLDGHRDASPLRTVNLTNARPTRLALTNKGRECARRITKVIADQGVQIALQPIVDLQYGAWSYAEALARFPDERPPSEWFVEAHAVGLGARLELHALEAACAAAAQLPAHIRLAVNASPELALHPRFGETLCGSGLPLDRLVLEITEHSAVADYPTIEEALLPYRQQGLTLAVDDAGAGYASFAHILQLRPEIIKLDRSLITGLDLDSASRAFVTGVTLLAYELGARVVGEGVETYAELDVLGNLGVDYAQGFLLARPTTDVAEWRRWSTTVWNIHGPQPVSSHPAAVIKFPPALAGGHL